MTPHAHVTPLLGALLCTVLNAQNFRQKSLKFLLIFSPNFGEFDKVSLVFAQILPDFFVDEVGRKTS